MRALKYFIVFLCILSIAILWGMWYVFTEIPWREIDLGAPPPDAPSDAAGTSTAPGGE